MSPNTISNTIAAALPTFAIVLFWLWKPTGRLLIPFHKLGDATQVGFFSLRDLSNPRPFASQMYRQVSMPIFVTVYVVNVFLVEAVSYPRALNEPKDTIFLIGLWLFVMVYAGSGITTIASAAFPFLLGYFTFGQSVFAGSMAVVLVVAFWHTAAYPQIYMLRNSISALRSREHTFLNGEQTTFPKFDNLRHVIGRWVPKILVVPLVAQIYFLFSGSSSFSTIIDNPFLDQYETWVLLIIYGPFAIDILLGGIFAYIQLDLFTFLSNYVFGRIQQIEAPLEGQLPESEDIDRTASNPFISVNDQVPDLSQLPLPKFRIALSFVAIDIFFSILSITDLPLLPGLTLRDVDLLAATMKIPYVLNVISTIYLDSQANRFSAGRLSSQSPTVRGESEYRKSIKRSLDRLLDLILARQNETKRSSYIDVRNNHYLSSLANDSTQFEGKVHL